MMVAAARIQKGILRTNRHWRTQYRACSFPASFVPRDDPGGQIRYIPCTPVTFLAMSFTAAAKLRPAAEPQLGIRSELNPPAECKFARGRRIL